MQTQNSGHRSITAQKTRSLPVSIRSCLFITSSHSSISRFDKFIIGMQTTWKVKEEIFDNIRIALHEALNNAVVHGNKSLAGRMVYIEASRENDAYSFIIQDEGNGFDPETVANPLASENINKVNGRGILIMKHLADAVLFSKNGTCIKLLFRSK